MDGQSTNPVERKTMPTEEDVECGQREVAEVFMVDRVELEVIDEIAKVRHLDLSDAVIREDRRDTLHEPVQVRNVCEHVVRDEDVRALSVSPQGSSKLRAEETAERRNAGVFRSFGRTTRRIDPEHGDPLPDEVAEQISVVARHLQDETVRAELTLSDQLACVLRRMRQKRVGERGGVRIVFEDLVRRNRV